MTAGEDAAGPAVRIDMHAHYYGGPLPEMLRARDARPCLRPAAGGGEEMLAMNGAFPFTPAHHDPAVGLAQMHATGLTHRMPTFPGALGVDVLPGAAAARAIAAFNDHLAELGPASGGALIGLAGLPLADLPAACREMTRVRRELGLPGAILPSNHFASIDRARALAPLLAAADAEGALLMLHPGLMPGEEPPPLPADFAQYRTSAVDLQSHAAQVTLTLVLSDLLDAYPRIRFQVVNLGGTVPVVLERMEAIARHRNPDAPFPTGRLRRIWYDCASLGPRALRAAVEVYGAERIMLGSDYPIFRDDPWAAALAPAGLDPEATAMIAGGTARDLLEGLGVAVGPGLTPAADSSTAPPG